MGSTRIKGNKKPVLTLGTPGTDRAADLISYRIENEAADQSTVTFEDAENGGGRQHFLRGSAIQSTATASFWRYVWENSGATGIPYTVAPHGNAVASANEPHFVGMLSIGAKPSLGGEASADENAAFQFDFEFKIDGEPTMDIGA